MAMFTMFWCLSVVVVLVLVTVTHIVCVALSFFIVLVLNLYNIRENGFFLYNFSFKPL